MVNKDTFVGFRGERLPLSPPWTYPCYEHIEKKLVVWQKKRWCST